MRLSQSGSLFSLNISSCSIGIMLESWKQAQSWYWGPLAVSMPQGVQSLPQGFGFMVIWQNELIIICGGYIWSCLKNRILEEGKLTIYMCIVWEGCRTRNCVRWWLSIEGWDLADGTTWKINRLLASQPCEQVCAHTHITIQNIAYKKEAVRLCVYAYICMDYP